MDLTTWVRGKDPGTMLQFARDKVSERRLRLLVCALARQYWDQLSESERHAITCAERYCDDLSAYEEMMAAGTLLSVAINYERYEYDRPRIPPKQLARETTYPEIGRAVDTFTRVSNIPGMKSEEHKSFVCSLIREVVGNPFAPPQLDPTWLTFNDGATVKLARSIHQDRDFASIPILGDALEEAGCQDRNILDHCRDHKANHVRGCWVLELILDAALSSEAAELESTLVTPVPAWLVRTRVRGRTSDFPLPEDARPHLIPLLARTDPEFVVARSYDREQLNLHPMVRSTKEIWYALPQGKFSLKEGTATRVEEGPGGTAYLWDRQKKALEEMAEVYPPMQLLWDVQRGSTKPLAEAAIQGDRKALFELARLLERVQDPRAEQVRKMLPGMKPLEEPEPSSSGPAPVPEDGPDKELEELRARATPCPRCGKSRRALRVRKEGPNHGRLFLACNARSCDSFEWASPPASAASTAKDADKEVADLQARATPCPDCGKPRRALRVRKEGPNHGRLFLSCSDRSCGSFEWASGSSRGGAPTQQDPYAPVFAELRRQYGECFCGHRREFGRVKKAGPNHGRFFARCPACEMFDWITDLQGDFFEPGFE